jgi:hypothetical protein
MLLAFKICRAPDLSNSYSEKRNQVEQWPDPVVRFNPINVNGEFRDNLQYCRWREWFLHGVRGGQAKALLED